MKYTQEQKDFWKQYFFSRGMLTIENAAIFADEALAEFNKRFVTPKNALLEHNLSICIANGVIGQRAEFQAVLNYLEKKRYATLQQLKLSLKSTQPFKRFSGSKAKLIDCTIKAMQEQGILHTETSGTKTLYSIR